MRQRRISYRASDISLKSTVICGMLSSTILQNSKGEFKMNREPMPLGLAIFLLIAGLFLGSVFTFGMQYWNSEVTPEECTVIDTEFVSYEERHGVKRPMEIKEIAIDCANGERYFIDGVSINTDLKNSLSMLSQQ